MQALLCGLRHASKCATREEALRKAQENVRSRLGPLSKDVDLDNPIVVDDFRTPEEQVNAPTTPIMFVVRTLEAGHSWRSKDGYIIWPEEILEGTLYGRIMQHLRGQSMELAD